MSLIFKPKIPESYSGHAVTKKSKSDVIEKAAAKLPITKKDWLTTDLDKVVELRAIGVSLEDMQSLIGRSSYSISAVIHDNKLYRRILEKRKAHIKNIMENTYVN
jgi:hypothetical protein